MPPDWGARLARRELSAGTRRRGASRTHGDEVAANGHSRESPTAEWLNDQPALQVHEPASSNGNGHARVAPATVSPRHARELHRRLARWRPAIWPFILAFVIDLVIVGWYTKPFGGLLGWPLTVLWTWPILTTFIGIAGIRRTRKALRRSKAHWSGQDPVTCEDFLIVVVSTIGRHDTYPALERSVLSYLAHLPGCFPRLRVDMVIDEGSEATGRIETLASQSELIRLVTVPASYCTQNGTRFKARASHYSHELRISEHEDRDDVWVLHMDDDTGVGPDTAVAMARFIEEQRQAGPRPSTWRRAS